MTIKTLLIILSYAISIGAGYVWLYFTAYAKKKAELKAVKETNKELTRQTEEIKNEFAEKLQAKEYKYIKEIEKLKNDYNLNFEKKKYTYEKKWEICENYFELFDNIEKQNFELITNKLIPLITTYYDEYLKANNNKELEVNAITKFTNSIQNFIIEQNKFQIELNTQTNKLNMIANKKIKNILIKLKESNKQNNEIINQIIQLLNYMAINKDFSKKDKIDKILNELAYNNKQLKDELMEEILKELEQI